MGNSGSAHGAAAPAIQSNQVSPSLNEQLGPVMRQDISRMTSSEQDRFCDAVDKMMEGKANDSEYFRIAAQHGWPGDYCSHGQEAFPSWHRAYIREFEAALQQADKSLGRDGRLALPYWDWMNISGPEVFPAVLRRRFPRLPSGLISSLNELTLRGYRIPNDARLGRDIKNSRIAIQAQEALHLTQHWQFASTLYRAGVSIELPHNSIHVVCGFPMNSVAYAAFHPVFFMHHCMIDRLYEAYLQADKDAQQEFESEQARKGAQGELNLYKTPLQPFINPVTGQGYMPMDIFSTREMGYVYDSLPLITPRALPGPVPTLVLFEKVEVMKLESKSYQLHVFLLLKGQAASWTPPVNPDEWDEQPEFAGMGVVFGGKGEGCENCKRRAPIDIPVDVTDRIRQMGVTRFDVDVVVMCLDEMGEVQRLEQTPIPPPILTGPFFESPSLVLQKDMPEEPLQQNLVQGEVGQLQTFLKKYGYFSEEVDGIFTQATDAAVRKLQSFLGLNADGIVGPRLKDRIMAQRVDSHADQVDEHDQPQFQPGDGISFWVGPVPGYLSQAAVADEVATALQKWAAVVPLSFVEVVSRQEASLTIQWADRTDDNLFKFDGKGGALAYASRGNMVLDVAERWLLQGTPAEPSSFYLLPILLHEFGHLLGLTHSQDPADAMCSFYDPAHTSLSTADTARISQLYPSSAGRRGAVMRAAARDAPAPPQNEGCCP